MAAVNKKKDANRKDVGTPDELINVMKGGQFSEVRIRSQTVSPNLYNDLKGILSSNSVITKLVLRGCGLKTKGTEAVCTAMKSNRTLEDLNLRGNEIGEPGAKHIAGLLEVNPTLTKLNLLENKLGAAGVAPIAQVIAESNTTLKELVVGNNNLKAAGAKHLAKILEDNKTLASLDLGVNSIGIDGAKHIELALMKNQNLLLLTIEASSTLISKRLQRNNLLRVEGKFEDAFKNNEKAPWQRSKLMVVGEGRAGKTATVRALLNKTFEENWDSTVGVDLNEVRTKDGQAWEGAEAVNLAQQFANRVVIGAFLQKNEGAGEGANEDMAVEDMDMEDDVEEEPEPVEEEPEEDEPEEDPVQVQVQSDEEVARALDLQINGGNGAAAQAPVAQAPEADKALKFDQQLFIKAADETDDIRISIWDYGGQTVFQTLHHLFLTRYGVYLMIFDMSSVANAAEDDLEWVGYMKFWMNSIRLYAESAPILLVGTFMDKLKKNEKKLIQKVDKLIKKNMAKELQGLPESHPDFSFIPISNKSGKNVPELRELIESTTKDQDFVHTEVSIKWMQCLDDLFKGEASWVTLDEFKAKCAIHEIIKTEEVEAMLDLFHELGMLLYFSNTEKLRNKIITKPQWVIDKISLVIRDKEIHKDYGAAKEEELRKANLTGDRDLLLEEGLVSRDLLESFWGKDELQYLIDFMARLLLISDWQFGEEKKFLVPSMVLKPLEQARDIKGLECAFKFDRFVPNGIFERIVCLGVAYNAEVNSELKPRLRFNYCKLWLQEGDKAVEIVKEAEEDSHTIRAFIEDEGNARTTVELLQSALRKIKEDLGIGKQFGWTTYVKYEGNDISYDDAKERNIAPWSDEQEVAGASAAVDDFINMM